MRKRTLAALLALTAVIAVVAILPRTPPGRAWLLGRLTSALHGAGVSVRYQHASGNLWAGVELDGADVRAPGVSLSARTLKIHYFLPSLIAGDLPLSVTVDGLRGSVDVAGLKGGGAGGGLPVRPRLQELTVSDASVSVQQVPYTLPSGAISHVRVRQRGSGLQIQAQLSTTDGNADVTGTLDPATPRFDGQVVQADVRLARHWFRGADGGTVSGPLHAGPDGVRADLTLQGGSLHAIGLQPHAIHGDVELDYPLVRANVTGTVLGGQVAAHGVVNIAARHWTAHAQGGAALLDTARWLARTSLPPGSALPLQGKATTSLDASGWTTVHVAGNAAGSGSFAGLPLGDLQADYSYDSAAGVKVQATGRVAGGAAVVSAVTGPDATTIEATANQMEPLAGQRVDVRAHLALGAGGPTGAIHVQDAGTLLARDVSVTLDGGVNADGWQAVIHGTDAKGATLQGAVALSGSDVSGEVRVTGLSVPAVRHPLTASLRADGKLSDLPLALTVGLGAPVTLEVGGERLAADLSGKAEATLQGARLTGIDAALGPFTVSGSLGLAPLAGQLGVAMAPTPVTGPVDSRLSIEGGRLAFANGRPEAGGTLHVGAVRAGPVRAPPITLDVSPASGTNGGIALDARDHGLHVTLANGRAQATLDGLPLEFAGVQARVDGSASAAAAHPLTGVRADLSVAAVGATLSVKGQGSALAANLHAPAGTRLGPLTLARPLALDGTIDLEAAKGELQGSLGEAPLHAGLTLGGGATATLSTTSAQGTMTFEAGDGRWRAHGALDVAPLAGALGLPVEGALTADLSHTGGAFRGTAQLDATGPLDARARLTGSGRELDATVTSSWLGRPLRLRGTLAPELTLEASAGPLGPVTLRNGQLAGSGHIAAQPLADGLSLRPLDWSVRGTLVPLAVDLDLGSAGTARLDAASGPRLAAALALPLRYGGRPLTLDLATAGTGPRLGAVGAPAASLGAGLGDVPLTARLRAGSGETVATASGSPASLTLHGSLPMALAGAPLPPPLAPAGNLAFDGNARLVAPRRLRLDGSWTAGSQTLAAKLSSSESGTSLSLQGAGLTVDVRPDRASVTADAAQLAPLFPGLPVAPRLDGALSRERGAYTGVMHVTLPRRGGATGTGSVTLSGHGASLAARSTGTLGPLDLRADGALLPAPRLQLDATAWGGAATLSATTAGPWSHLTVSGALTTEALSADPWVALPARRVTFQADAASGAVSAKGEGLTLDGTLADMRGHLTLPFRALGGDERLDLHASGSLASPKMEATLDGAVTGKAAGAVRDGVHVDVSAARQALSRLLALPGASLASDVRVVGDAHLSGAWHANSRSALDVGGRNLPVEAALDGAAAEYRGTLTVGQASAGQLLQAAVTGSGTDARVRVDLGQVDYAAVGTLVGLPLHIDASGTLTLNTRPLAASLQIDASGSAAGRPVALDGHARSGDVSLQAGYGSVHVDLAGTGTAPLQLEVRDAATDLALQGSLAAGASPALTLRGTVDAVPASLTLDADLAGRSGRLKAALGDASLDAQASPAGKDVTLSVSADARPGSLAPLGVPLGGSLRVEAAASPSSGTAALQRLALSLSGGPTPLYVALSGSLYPHAELSGTASAPGWDVSGGLSVNGPPAALNAGLTLGGLHLLARLEGRHLARLAADGSTRLTPFGRATTLQARAFQWDGAAGFAGKATLTLQDTPAALDGPLAFDLEGHGPLAVSATVGPSAGPWAALDAQLAADPSAGDAWRGHLRLDLPLATLAGVSGPGRLTLRGAPTLAGDLLHPDLQGAIALAGAVDANGTVSWQAGQGRLRLSGDHVALQGDLQGAVWHAAAKLDGLPLEPFAPALAGAHASLEANLSGGTSSGLEGSLSNLVVAAPGASLTGTASVQKGIRVALQVSADLSAMQLPGPPLEGLVRGPLVLAAPDLSRLGDGTLIAVLDVAHLGARGVDASLDGNLQVGGTLTAPAVTATLQGSGQAHGQVRGGAALNPRRLDLHSTLGYRALTTDLNVSVHDAAVEATGHAAYGKAEVAVSTTPGGDLMLRGAQALSGWQASVPASLATATVSGPLEGLGAGAAGHLRLTLGGRPWLDGSVRGAALGGVALGDLTLGSEAPGSPLRLTGQHLNAQLDPTTLDWQLRVDAQPLPGGATVSGTANGHAATGSASLDLGGTVAGQPASVSLKATRRQALAFDAQGTLIGGQLDAHVSRPNASTWQGSVDLKDAGLAGVSGSLQGTVGTGPQGGPELNATTILQGTLAGKAQVHASRQALAVDANLQGDVLAGEVTASGTLAPKLDLALSSKGSDGGDHGTLHLYLAGNALRGDGELRLGAGPARVSLTGGGNDGALALGIAVPAVPGLAFEGSLPTEGPRGMLRKLDGSGFDLAGTGATAGTLTLRASPAPHAELANVSLEVASLRVTTAGSVSPGAADLTGAVQLPDGLPVDDLAGASVPYSLGWKAGTLTLTSDGPTGRVDAWLEPSAGSGHVTADLHTLGAHPGSASVNVTFDPRGGAGGHVEVAGVTVKRPELPGLTVAADIALGSGKASGSIDVGSAHGGLHADGDWGLADLLPAAMAPTGQHGGNAELRVSTFDLSTLPTLQRVAPHLAGSASGVIRFRNRTVVGQVLIPDLRVADTALPLDAQVSGTLGKLDARVKLGSSLVTATLEPGAAKGLLRFQSFPAQVLAEATTGPTDITANVDGVMRFDVPYGDPASAYLRMATQRVTLERAGVTTTGNLSWVYNDRAVTVTDAAFEGRGSWNASGTVDASTLDLRLSASDADFSPLLDLVPMFARYGVGASGSFDLRAQGTPADPNVTLRASGLEARVAGTRYRIEHGQADLQGRSLTGSAHVVGVAPLGGSVDVRGSAHLSLAPLSLSNTDFTFSGSAELPVVGTVTDLSGGITQQQGQPPQLALTGKLGKPFQVRGSLTPFDVTVKGNGLDLQAPPLFITSSTVDADVRVHGTSAGLAIGGRLDASEVHMNIGAPSAPGGSSGATSTGQAGGSSRQPNGSAGAPPSASAASQPSGAAQPSTPSSSASLGSSATRQGASGRAARAARESVLFDHLHLRAPQRVLLDAGFGNAEASLDLTLTGNAASPKLDGQAQALRGTLTFAGRDFTIDRATASFQASRGVYPTLDVQAHTEFDKQRVLGSAADLSFAAPRDSNTFEVALSFSGQVQPAKQGPSPVTFDIRPTLSSNAQVQSTSDTGTSSPRPLSDSELLSLVTLGRLGVTPQLAGQSAFGTAVAQSALDTAVDVLVVSELQNALSKALGIDVVQIQTTPLSSLLENNGQPFGVALRLGGYLTPELFASYRLGNYSGANGSFGLSNEVSLSYDLGPLNFDLSGRLSFPDATPNQGAVPELGVGLRYAFTNNLGLEAGIDLSDVRRQARFGVSVHW